MYALPPMKLTWFHLSDNEGSIALVVNANAPIDKTVGRSAHKSFFTNKTRAKPSPAAMANKKPINENVLSEPSNAMNNIAPTRDNAEHANER